MNKIGIRCDCGSIMGMGHIARQYLIYRELKKLGYEVSFFMEKGKDLIESWDLPLLDMSLINDMDCLIIDLLTGFEHFNFSKRKIAFYDGPKKIECDAEVIFIPNYQQKKSWYDDKKYFIGFDYILMEPELLKVGIKRTFGDLKKILIMTSGVDLWDMPKQILFPIKDMGYQIFVKTSGAYSSERINYLEKNDVKIIYRINNISDLYNDYDLMICTAGNALFEAAVAGLPCISFSANDVQEGYSAYLDEKGFSVHLGGFWNNTARLEKLPDTIKFLSDILERKKRSKKGRKIRDGKGLKRMINIIIGESK